MRKIIMASVLIAGATGCGELTEPQSQARLYASWREVQEPSSNRGTMQSTLTFGADGSYTSELRVFGGYPGQAGSDLSGYIIATGTYAAVDGSIRMRLQRQRTWDFFNGADSPERVEEFAPSEPMYDWGRFEFVHHMLVRRYTSYPADAPVPATRVYLRVK